MSYSKYPQQIDTSNELPATIDRRTPVIAEVVNRLRDAVLNIEGELGVDPSGTYGTVRARLDALEATIGSGTPAPTSKNKNMTPNNTVGNGVTTGLSLTKNPIGNSKYVGVIINGVHNSVGDGVKNRDCYFSRDGGVTALNLSQLAAFDTLYWNGNVAGFNLANTDVVDFDYDV